MVPSRFARWLFFVVVALGLFSTSAARAATYTPPPLRGHVVDESHTLTDGEVRALDQKLDRARRQTGFAIVVLVLPRLPDGLSIEDVGYGAINGWGVGAKGSDDGVVLIADVGEHKLRIETGKGVGGALTDIASSHINREVIGPLLKEGKTYEAMDRGTDAIVRELVSNTEGGKSDSAGRPTRGQRSAPHPMTARDYVTSGAVILAILGVIVLAIVSPTFRGLLFFFLLSGRSRNDDDNDGWGGGGGGGSGYGGGGGTGGGGGSSDDY